MSIPTNPSPDWVLRNRRIHLALHGPAGEHHHLWGPSRRGGIRDCMVRGCEIIQNLDDDEAYDYLDKFGRWWPDVDWDERCDGCGQPDNIGDCNHEPLSKADVVLLGGVIPKLDGTDDPSVFYG